MKVFVFWTGVLDLLVGAALSVPTLSQHLFPREQVSLGLQLFALVAMFLGVMLILCSRNLETRGALVVWEGVLRCFGFVVFASYGICRGAGWQVTACGLGDLAIGAAYLAGLPRVLNVRLSDLLLDRGHK